MAIDLSQVEPLGSKSVLMEQAMRRQREQKKMGATANYYADMHEDMVQPDFEWLKDDQAAIKNLVTQMDASVGQLAQQLAEVQSKSERSRQYIEKEQQLLFKQIHTLNGLLKKQIDVFSVMERQVSDMHIQNNKAWQSVAIGVVAGLASAITILAASPFAVMLLQKLSVV
ncbi:hypothetical protein J3998_08195 [Thiomicrorhabdus sp. 6S2-11]|jgi:glutaredoxin 2|uniref:Uncharacterized protein n=1 Tax=Thiomicrorhabdus marina TaxID=2818442 RepID=A0ABS3Q5Z8_9GAMM|nr:hypothetical protein [Thiomicrorhabdus marina]MBO1927558.1 hypothetical protein [Thiomicrorhabdus marina]